MYSPNCFGQSTNGPLQDSTMRVLSLPKTLDSADDFDGLIERYKAYRLLSLQLSPHAFGSSYDREVVFPRDTWVGRLSSPLSTNIIAVAGQPDSCEENAETALLFHEEWLGSLLLRGPLDKDATIAEFGSYFTDSMGKALDDSIECYFGLFAMYVLPTSRGLGVGTAVLEYAKKEALRQGQGVRTRMILMLDPGNPAALRTYEKCGFELKFTYSFDDFRPGKSGKTNALVMLLDIGGEGS